jgi:hypothetical protein
MKIMMKREKHTQKFSFSFRTSLNLVNFGFWR